MAHTAHSQIMVIVVGVCGRLVGYLEMWLWQDETELLLSDIVCGWWVVIQAKLCGDILYTDCVEVMLPSPRPREMAFIFGKPATRMY